MLNSAEFSQLKNPNLSHLARTLYVFYLKPEYQQGHNVIDLRTLTAQLVSYSEFLPLRPSSEQIGLALNELEKLQLVRIINPQEENKLLEAFNTNEYLIAQQKQRAAVEQASPQSPTGVKASAHQQPAQTSVPTKSVTPAQAQAQGLTQPYSQDQTPAASQSAAPMQSMAHAQPQNQTQPQPHYALSEQTKSLAQSQLPSPAHAYINAKGQQVNTSANSNYNPHVNGQVNAQALNQAAGTLGYNANAVELDPLMREAAPNAQNNFAFSTLDMGSYLLTPDQVQAQSLNQGQLWAQNQRFQPSTEPSQGYGQTQFNPSLRLGSQAQSQGQGPRQVLGQGKVLGPSQGQYSVLNFKPQQSHFQGFTQGQAPRFGYDQGIGVHAPTPGPADMNQDFKARANNLAAPDYSSAQNTVAPAASATIPHGQYASAPATRYQQEAPAVPYAGLTATSNRAMGMRSEPGRNNLCGFNPMLQSSEPSSNYAAPTAFNQPYGLTSQQRTIQPASASSYVQNQQMPAPIASAPTPMTASMTAPMAKSMAATTTAVLAYAQPNLSLNSEYASEFAPQYDSEFAPKRSPALAKDHSPKCAPGYGPEGYVQNAAKPEPECLDLNTRKAQLAAALDDLVPVADAIRHHHQANIADQATSQSASAAPDLSPNAHPAITASASNTSNAHNAQTALTSHQGQVPNRKTTATSAQVTHNAAELPPFTEPQADQPLSALAGAQAHALVAAQTSNKDPASARTKFQSLAHNQPQVYPQPQIQSQAQPQTADTTAAQHEITANSTTAMTQAAPKTNTQTAKPQLATSAVTSDKAAAKTSVTCARTTVLGSTLLDPVNSSKSINKHDNSEYIQVAAQTYHTNLAINTNVNANQSPAPKTMPEPNVEGHNAKAKNANTLQGSLENEIPAMIANGSTLDSDALTAKTEIEICSTPVTDETYKAEQAGHTIHTAQIDNAAKTDTAATKLNHTNANALLPKESLADNDPWRWQGATISLPLFNHQMVVEPRKPFRMYAEWQPGPTLADAAHNAGLINYSYEPQVLQEFVSYWLNRGDERTQYAWERTFVKRLLKLLVLSDIKERSIFAPNYKKSRKHQFQTLSSITTGVKEYAVQPALEALTRNLVTDGSNTNVAVDKAQTAQNSDYILPPSTNIVGSDRPQRLSPQELLQQLSEYSLEEVEEILHKLSRERKFAPLFEAAPAPDSSSNAHDTLDLVSGKHSTLNSDVNSLSDLNLHTPSATGCGFTPEVDPNLNSGIASSLDSKSEFFNSSAMTDETRLNIQSSTRQIGSMQCTKLTAVSQSTTTADNLSARSEFGVSGNANATPSANWTVPAHIIQGKDQGKKRKVSTRAAKKALQEAYVPVDMEKLKPYL